MWSDNMNGFGRSVMAIAVSEIGDKTFLTAAILAVSRPRLTVFAGAICALGLMSFLSALLGTIVPQLLPKQYTTIAAAVLFEVFGLRMLKEGLEMKNGADKEAVEEEMAEVQRSIEKEDEEIKMSRNDAATGRSRPLTNRSRHQRTMSTELSELEAEEGLPQFTTDLNGNKLGPRSSFRTYITKAKHFTKVPSLTELGSTLHALFYKIMTHLASPTFIESFVLTFVAEWGDRSQIVTMALAAAHSVFIVTLGTTLGHAMCSGLAVISGRWISQHVSVKHVTLGGAVTFILFGFIYAREAYMNRGQ